MQTVLIADDDYLVRMFLKQMIDWKSFGFQVAGDAKNDAEALKLAKQLHPDLIITDVCMPVMDGIDLVRALKEQHLGKHILVLSNHDDFEYVRAAMKLGIDDYLLKNDLSPENLTKFLQKFQEEDTVSTQTQKADISSQQDLIQLGKIKLMQDFWQNFSQNNEVSPKPPEPLPAVFASASALLIQLRDFSQRRQDWKESELQTFLTSFQNALQNLCAHERSHWPKLQLISFQPIIGEDTWGLIIAFSKENSLAKVMQIVQQLAHALPTFLQRYFALNASICILKPQANWQSLQKHWQRAYSNRFASFYAKQDIQDIIEENLLVPENVDALQQMQNILLQDLPAALAQDEHRWQTAKQKFFTALQTSHLSFTHLQQLIALFQQQASKQWDNKLDECSTFNEFQQSFASYLDELHHHARIAHPAIRQAVNYAGVKLQIGFCRRFDHNHHAVYDMVKSGKVGTPQLIRISSRDPEPPSIDYVKVSGGIFFDMMIHDFDMARFLAGDEVEEVYAQGSVLIDPEIGKAGDVDTAVVTLKFKNGAIATIDNSRKAVYGYDQRVEVFGSKGVAMNNNDIPNTATFADANGTVGGTAFQVMWDRYEKAFVTEMKCFAKAVAEDTETLVTGQDGLYPV